MNRVPTDLLQVIAYGLGNDTWQQFVDRYEEKYNAAQIDGFDFAPLQLGYTFQQLMASTGATSMPAYVDPESPGYEAALREVKGQTGNIPTMKKFYRLNRVILRERLQLLQQVGAAALTPEMANVFTSLLDEGTDGLISSFMNALTHQRMQIVSTLKFTIDTTNNPRGLKGITIDFAKDGHRFSDLSGSTATSSTLWWLKNDFATEGGKSDPIQYIRNKVREIRNTYHYYGGLHVEMSQAMFDAFLMHSKVLSRVGAALYPTASVDTASLAQNLSDVQIAEVAERLCGVKITPKDTYAYVDAPDQTNHDIVTTQVENFSSLNIAFVPDGKIGDIMGASPITLGYDSDKVALYNGGRLVLTQRAIPETHSVYIESEAAQLCVPSNVDGMFVAAVTTQA